MISAGRVIKILFYSAIVLLVIKGGVVLYHNISYRVVSDKGFNIQSKFDFSDAVSDKDLDQGKECYNFKRMLSLIDACEKVKYIEHLQFSRPGQVERVDLQTLKSLTVALKQERKRLKHFMWQLRAYSRHSVPSKRMKALKYYLRVLDLNMQDIEEITFTRDEPTITGTSATLTDAATTVSREEAVEVQKGK